ncbi:MAG: DUF2007 domain-containing protein [Planctomycetota bacterium]
MTSPSSWTVVESCTSSMHAELLRIVLEDAGIPCRLSSSADGHGGAIVGISPGYQVLVRSQDVVRARKAIHDARDHGSGPPDSA